ncbi:MULTISPECIES: thiamine diphosphokinase [Clostridium]|uniref:thiamine diphosphokinase n=1 Tax=Clostridium TaxID=1485 RepID=UPI000BBBFB40|nr:MULTISPECIES: thiamine diphosphokinase [Clostridium]MBY1426624.1 thiamine diphosphokinase [Clostridioides difficile]HBG6281270.1 thiamine diphosphokinase [Clostridioides difficile]HBG6283623.1 thiamine diphosphokinase [Clostridioides difficile]
MKDKICYIVGAGENYGLDFVPLLGDYVIAADGGLKYLEQSSIKANLVIGDFDTLHYKPNHPNVITLSEEKDDTDMLAAMREGINKGYSIFHIYCGMGGRIEHTIANMQLLAYLSQHNRKGLLFGQDCIITAVTNGSIEFSSNAKGRISVFSFSNISTGVYLKGLKYKLDNATLTTTFPIGVSNEFTGKESVVTVTDGTILVVFPNELKEEI